MKNSFALLILSASWCFSQGQDHQKADSLFYAANSRLKDLSENIDSSSIEKSIADYSEAIQLNPKFWQAYRNRARLYHSINQFDKAIADLNQALSYADTNSAINLHDMRANSYYAVGQYKDAISDWTIAVDNLGNPSLALLQRAKAEWRLGQKDKACADFKRAIELDRTLAKDREFLHCE